MTVPLSMGRRVGAPNSALMGVLASLLLNKRLQQSGNVSPSPPRGLTGGVGMTPPALGTRFGPPGAGIRVPPGRHLGWGNPNNPHYTPGLTGPPGLIRSPIGGVNRPPSGNRMAQLAAMQLAMPQRRSRLPIQRPY